MKVKIFALAFLTLFVAFASMPALANDQITSNVVNGSGPEAVIVNNGVPSGTIQLWYTYTAGTFPCGQFSTFNFDVLDLAGSGKQVPTYPVGLNLAQSGKGPVQLVPSPAQFSVSGIGWTDSSTVSVAIDCSQLPPETPFDGQEIVGNLNVNTSPSGAHLDTISTIQVHIKLAIPETPCLKLYSFETDQDSGTLLSGIVVNANKSGSIKSTNPGTISADGMVVNTCQEAKSFDLQIGLDPLWQTIPFNNPGNATFTYTLAGEMDPGTLGVLTNGTPQGQTLCLRNVTLVPGDSFLANVHSAIMSGMTKTNLDADHDFDFSAELYSAGTTCTGAPLGAELVSPANPAISALPFTVQ